VAALPNVGPTLMAPPPPPYVGELLQAAAGSAGTVGEAGAAGAAGAALIARSRAGESVDMGWEAETGVGCEGCEGCEGREAETGAFTGAVAARVGGAAGV
jgi:hypothetical protein